MTRFNAVVVPGVDLLLGPLGSWPPLVSLSLASLVTAVALLIVVRLTSNQAALAAAKRQIHADLLEMRLFNDDLRATLRAQAAILRHNAVYLRLALVPMLWAALPLALLTVHLQAWFGYTGVDVGRATAITVRLKAASSAEGAAAPAEATLEAAGIQVEPEAIWFPSLRELVWQIVPAGAGDHTLVIQIDDRRYEKSLHVSNGLARRSPERVPPDLVAQWLSPSESPLPAAAAIDRINVNYPERTLRFLGWELHWTLLYVVESLVFAMALKRPFGVII